jgi:hypothetical protein
METSWLILEAFPVKGLGDETMDGRSREMVRINPWDPLTILAISEFLWMREIRR